MSFRIAIAQILGNDNPSSKNIRANSKQIRTLMREAHAAGALSSYPSKRLMSSLGPDELGESDWSKVAWDLLHEELESVVALAGKLKLWVVVGSVHKIDSTHRP